MDFSKAARRRRYHLPSGAKLLFLFLPWVLVAYGVSALQEFVAFYNNSSEATARVVYTDETDQQLSFQEAQSMLAETGTWPHPAFLYQHANGLFYIGRPIVDPSNWHYHHGELVDVRFNRLDPSQAQPVSIFKFWWTPGIFIVGGLAIFASLFVAFYSVGRPKRPGPKWWHLSYWRRKDQKLNLRRK